MQLPSGLGISRTYGLFQPVSTKLRQAVSLGVFPNDVGIRCRITGRKTPIARSETSFDFSNFEIALFTLGVAREPVIVEMLEDKGKVRRSLRPPALKPSRGNSHAKSKAMVGCGQLCRGIRLYD